MFLIEVREGNGPWIPFDVREGELHDVLEAPPVRPRRPGGYYDRHNWRARRILPCQRCHYEAEIRTIWQPD